jgi:uncharacterized protein YjbI with pentapeptide repeats
MTKIEIKNRWNGAVIYSFDVPDDVPSGLALRHALEKAVSINADLSGADLRGANLRGADLSSANLSSANLRGADLRGADLSSADLSGADLRGADLSNADLSGADLSGADLSSANLSSANLSSANLRSADLRGANLRSADLSSANLRGANLRSADLSSANLRGADLRGADLSSADLSSADLSGADLRGADLSSANLRMQKNDFWAILLHATKEIAGLRLALIQGRVDGSTYEGACACLVGTIGNVRGVHFQDIGVKPDSSRPAERWFMGIKKGDTPETNQISRITVEWLDEFVGLLEASK